MGTQPSCSGCSMKPCAFYSRAEGHAVVVWHFLHKIPWVCSPKMDAQAQCESGCPRGPRLPSVSSPLALISRASWVVLAGPARKAQLLIKLTCVTFSDLQLGLRTSTNASARSERHRYSCALLQTGKRHSESLKLLDRNYRATWVGWQSQAPG